MSKLDENLCAHELSEEDGYCYKCGAFSYKNVIHILFFIFYCNLGNNI